MTDMSRHPEPEETGQITAIRDTFTLRDMNRQPQAVLNAARRLGRIYIQGRSGERFVIQPEPAESRTASTRETFRERLRELRAQIKTSGDANFTHEGWETFSQMIAGPR